MADIVARFENEEQVIADLGQVSPNVRKRVGERIRVLQYELMNSARAAYSAAGLHSRTGGLLGSIQVGEYVESDTEISGSVVAGGGDAFYARAQEFGAEISAKNVTFLTIPLDAAKTGMGVGRYSARQVIDDPSIGGYVSTFFHHNILLGVLPTAKRRGEGAIPGVEPLFALKSSVTLPERSFMRVALRTMAPRVASEMQDAVSQGAKD